jgi:hypothetical protein
LDSDLTLADGVTLYVVHGLTVNAVLTLASTGSETRLFFDGQAVPGDQTLGGTGQVVFGGTGGRNALAPRFTTLTLGAGLTIHGASGSIGNSTLPLINQGTITADVAGSVISVNGGPFANQGLLETRPGAVLTLNGSWTNTGTIRVAGGELDLRGVGTTVGLGKLERAGGVVKLLGTLDNTGATLALDATTGPWVLAGGVLRGGRLLTSGGGTLEIPPSVAAGTLDGVTLDSDLTLADGVTLYVVHGLTVNAVLTLASTGSATQLFFDGQAVPGDQTLGGTGQVVFGGTGGRNALAPRFTTLTLGAGLTIHGASGSIGNSTLPLINQGTITADVAGGTIVIQGKPFTNNGTTSELNGGKIVVLP